MRLKDDVHNVIANSRSMTLEEEQKSKTHKLPDIDYKA